VERRTRIRGSRRQSTLGRIHTTPSAMETSSRQLLSATWRFARESNPQRHFFVAQTSVSTGERVRCRVDLPTRISCITSPAPGSAYRMLYARPRAGKGTQRDRPVRWRQAKHQAVNFTSGASAVSKIFSSSEDLLTPGIGLNNHLRATKYLVATALNSRKSRLMLPEPRFG
jgi:hypothetical protein